jgi:ferredoxin
MMGDGPAAGDPANARLLMGGFDPVAVDTVAAQLMGFNPAKVPMIYLAEKVGVGSSRCEVIGDPINSFKLRLEKPTVAKNRIKSALFNLGGRFFFRKMGEASRMVVDAEKCTLCGRCQTMCPFGAITIADRAVLVDESKCQFCLCCTEVCKAEAIYLKGPLVQKGSFLRG